MNWIVWVVALAFGGLVLSYAVTGWMLKPLNEAERAHLEEAGTAHDFAALPSGATHFRHETANGEGAASNEEPARPLIVLVHGYSTPSFVYNDYFAPLTAAGFDVLSFDLYGRGFSDRPSGTYGVDRYTGQLGHLLDHIAAARPGSNAPVHLVGYSMGGAIVTHFANLHPERVASMTLIAPAGLAVPEGQVSPIMFSPLVGEWVFRVLGANLMQKGLTDGFDDYAPDPEAFTADFARQFDYRGLDHALLDTIRAFGRGEFQVDFANVHQARIPVQAFFSEDDSVIPIISATRLEELNPDAEIHRFTDGDHAIGYGRADEIAAGIVVFAGR